jgi:uncharacterized repeat protein (TIGR02543 family)
MGAPSGIVWGAASNDYVKIGIYVKTTNTDTQTTAVMEVWLASKYSLHDSNNQLKVYGTAIEPIATYGDDAILVNDIKVSTDKITGSGWSTDNHQKLWTRTVTYDRTTSAQNKAIQSYFLNIYNHTIKEVTIFAKSVSFAVPALASYNVSYYANGGSGAPSTQTKYYGTSLKLSSTKPTRSGYTFKSWNTKADGSGTSYSPGATYSANAALSLYAQWSINRYTITYNANEGTNAPSATTGNYGTTVTLSTTEPTRVGYKFLGWSKSSTATTATYKAGASYSLTASVTLYAVWQYIYEKPTITNVTASRCKPLTITPTSFDDFELSDEGTWIVVKYDCTTFLSVTTNTVEWYELGGETHELTNISGTNIWYTSEDSLLSGGTTAISLESTYQVRITVADELDSSTSVYDIYGSKMAIDIRPDTISYAHIESIDVGGSNSNHVYYNTSSPTGQYFNHTEGKLYTLSFIARSPIAGTVLVSCTGGSPDQNKNTYVLSTRWQTFVHEYTAVTTAGSSLTLWLESANTSADITNITLSEDGGNNVLSDSHFLTSTNNWTTVGTHTITAKVDTGGLGMAVGKTAEHAGVFDIGLTAKFTNGIQNEVLITSDGVGVDLNTVLTPNTYVGVNKMASSYANKPDGLTGTFTLEVLSAGAEGQILQRITQTKKDEIVMYYRHYYQNSWGEWIRAGTEEYVLYSNDAGSNGDITLNSSVRNYRYIEIYFTDNNGLLGGYTKVYSPHAKAVCLHIQEGAPTIYSRQTVYGIAGTLISPDTENASYVRFTNGAYPQTSIGTNYIKIVRVVGYV